MKISVEQLAAEKGYRFGGTVKASDPDSGVKLLKGERAVVVDQALLDDIAAMAAPLENADETAPVRAVS